MIFFQRLNAVGVDYVQVGLGFDCQLIILKFPRKVGISVHTLAKLVNSKVWGMGLDSRI